MASSSNPNKNVAVSVQAMTEWLSRCLEIVGFNNSTPRRIEEDLSERFPEHQWIVRPLGRNRYLVEVPTPEFKRECLSNGCITYGAEELYLAYDPLVKVHEQPPMERQWIRILGLPLPLRTRPIIKEIVSRFGILVEEDWYSGNLLDLRYVRVQIEVTNLAVIPVQQQIPHLEGIPENLAGVVVTMRVEDDEDASTFTPGEGRRVWVDDARLEALLSDRAGGEDLNRFLARFPPRAVVDARARDPELRAKVRFAERMKNGYNGTGGAQSPWLHEEEMFPVFPRYILSTGTEEPQIPFREPRMVQVPAEWLEQALASSSMKLELPPLQPPPAVPRVGAVPEGEAQSEGQASNAPETTEDRLKAIRDGKRKRED